MSEKEVVNLLWTSGWDSTYRLVDLLLKGKIVQPHYIKFNDRESTDMELNRMEEIKEFLISKKPILKNRILPSIIVDSESIIINKNIQESHNRIVKDNYLGKQYVLIASYARECDFDLELSIHSDDKAYEIIKDYIELIEEDKDKYYKIIANSKSDAAEVFKDMRFPLLDTSKIEMENKAIANGFDDVLEMTWFCHRPTKKGKPCGMCNPCIYTVEEGLGRRMPLTSRIKAKPVKILKSLKLIKSLRKKLKI